MNGSLLIHLNSLNVKKEAKLGKSVKTLSL